ncbi:MAG: sorbosone dehydrogenase family protein [Ginsengibacter sp.]
MRKLILIITAGILFSNCSSRRTVTSSSSPVVRENLPAPYATPSADNRSETLGWSGDKMPVAPAGFKVIKYASGLNNPRWIYEMPNGDILVSQASTRNQSANNILLFRERKGDGSFDKQSVFLSGLNKPFGMLVIGNIFYVANTDGVFTYPYQQGDTMLSGPGTKILDLPAGGYNNHWTRNILANSDNSKIYVSVGSGSNVGEHGMANEIRRANILEINPDGTGEVVYAAGLRNPVGMAWEPVTKQLWTSVNERDGLGDDLVPDYTTSVKRDGFYGWPYAYFGQHEDPRLKGQNPALVAKAIVPDVPLGSHTASLGLDFYTGTAFPAKYKGGAFIGQHGSWNRSEPVGYKVVFVPFTNGKPGTPEDFLTGFVASKNPNAVYGKPVCIRFLKDGSMLVADDTGNTIWQITSN